MTDEFVPAAERTQENMPRTTGRNRPRPPRAGDSYLDWLNEQIAQTQQQAPSTVGEPDGALLLQSYVDVYIRLLDAAYRERVRDLVIKFTAMAIVFVAAAIPVLLAIAVVVALEGSSAWRAPLAAAGGLVGLLCWTLRRMVRVAEPDSDLNRQRPSRSLLRHRSRRHDDQAE